MDKKFRNIDIITTNAPKHYRLRHTVGGGFELLGGYECTRYVGGEPSDMYIEWRPLPTLEAWQLPEDKS